MKAHARRTTDAERNLGIDKRRKNGDLSGLALHDVATVAQDVDSCACGGVCPKCQYEVDLPSAVTVRSGGDAYEQEAEATADRIMSTQATALSHDTTSNLSSNRTETPGSVRSDSAAHGEVLRIDAADSGGKDEDALLDEECEPKKLITSATSSGMASSLLGGSSSLPQSEIDFFHSHFGYDFSNVRIHDDQRADEIASNLNARAFASGMDIVFRHGQYQPGGYHSRHLLAHELTHVLQQSKAAAPVIQRNELDAEEEEYEDLEPEEETPRYRWIDYAEAAIKNRQWFELLQLGPINPFSPYDPYNTPVAFINHVTHWQSRAKRAQLAEYVFAAEDAQQQVRDGSLSSVVEGLAELQQRFDAGEAVEMGDALHADGILGPRTLWTMLVAAAFSTNPQTLQILEQFNIPLEPLETLAHDDREEWYDAWQAVHAYLFNPPQFQATWSTVANSELVFQAYETLHGLRESDQEFLQFAFFPEGIPEEIEIAEPDLIAMLARVYEDDALDGIVSIFDVDRSYFHVVDLEKLLLAEDPPWRGDVNIRMAEMQSTDVEFIVNALGLQVPSNPDAQQGMQRIAGQQPTNRPLGQTAEQGLTVFAIIFRLPPKPSEVWARVAEQYVREKQLLEQAADEAVLQYLAELEQRHQQRMQGDPDIGPSDAMAFLELLVGDVFASAQEARVEYEQTAAVGYDVDIIPRYQRSTSSAQVRELLALAERERYLIVQLGDEAETRFPLPLQQIETSRRRAAINGREPLPFDLIDTPHAAMHMYSPYRFSARATDSGSMAHVGRYELSHDSDLGEEGDYYEDWHYYKTNSRYFDNFEPVLVEIREFNPDAGQLFRAGRQLFGTDKVYLRYVWTLGGSLPSLHEQLWDAQGWVNLFGWIDAGLSIAALASVVAAPLIAGGEAAGTTAAAELGQTAINAAIRKALVEALKRFVVGELIGEALGRITFHLNDSEDVPDEVKKAWNGLMIMVLIYGIGAATFRGIKTLRERVPPAYKAELEALESSLEAELRAGRSGAGAADDVAEAELRQLTRERHRQLVGDELGSEQATGTGRVRSDDPLAATGTEVARGITSEEADLLRRVLGEQAADQLSESVSATTRRRLASIDDPDAIRTLNEALPPEQLTRLLASLDPESAARLARQLDPTSLRGLVTSLGASAEGVGLMRAFSPDAHYLTSLLDELGDQRLLALARDPGPGKLYLTSRLVDSAAFIDAAKNIGRNNKQSLPRFRQLINDVGPENAALVMNTYTGREIGHGSRWRARKGMSAAQNVTRIAISRAEPTQARLASGIPIPDVVPRAATLMASDFRTFFAIGPEGTAPSIIRSVVTDVQVASARAANHLDEILDRAARGVLTDADLQALPPQGRATVEAFLRATPTDSNYHALYGSALQYLAEAEVRAMYGGSLPPGMAFRHPESRGSRTLVPDVQIELTLESQLRYPDRNTVERAVIDWTTAGEAGKIVKYRGGDPPVTYAVEVIQPGPPPPRPTTVTPPVVTPNMPTASPDVQRAQDIEQQANEQ